MRFNIIHAISVKCVNFTFLGIQDIEIKNNYMYKAGNDLQY